MQRYFGNFKTFSAILLVGMTSIFTTGCGTRVIDRAIVTPSQDFKSIEVLLQFDRSVEMNLLGSLELAPHGRIFMSPSTPEAPFLLGFDLNTAVLSDPKYFEMQRTQLLPNGAPSMLPYPVVEIKSTQPIGNDFDLYG
ncbi:MAG TPA: hypothetical protein DCS07_08355, partial [Bdellovibrionales bacterium]|nr:hypothetical protein [Bdellovibrionales bacterium]